MLRKQGPRASRRTVRKFPCPMQASPQVIPSPPWPVHACFWPVAAMAVLNVVEPWASSAAGNGSATCLDGKTGKVISMAFTGGAPARLDPDVDPKDLDEGPKAVTVPGAFGGWIELARRYGRRPLSTLLEPAIGYARDGHPLDESITGYIRDAQASIARYPTTAAIFLADGKIPAPRGTFRNVSLARTFQAIADAETAAIKSGADRERALDAAYDYFYSGPIAQEFDRFMRKGGGWLNLEDMRAYRPRWADPASTAYRGYDVYCAPLTSRTGLEVCEPRRRVWNHRGDGRHGTSL